MVALMKYFVHFFMLPLQLHTTNPASKYSCSHPTNILIHFVQIPANIVTWCYGYDKKAHFPWSCPFIKCLYVVIDGAMLECFTNEGMLPASCSLAYMMFLFIPNYNDV